VGRDKIKFEGTSMPARLRQLLPLVAFALVLGAPIAAPAQTIIDQWSNITTPPAPELKPVTVDPTTTALLMLDFVKQTCNQQRRPRCLATLPKVKNLLAEARAKNMLVIYSLVPGATTGDVLPEVAPTGNEPAVSGALDKFLTSNLEQILKDKNITTVIVVGTAAHGAVMYTASAAAVHGLKVIVPVDGMSAESPYIEQYVTYNFTSAPVVANGVTLTSIDMLKF
jgi:nicotinamidase-related amidase